MTNANLVKTGDEKLWSGDSNKQYYKDMFEREFIRQSEVHYKTQAQQWFNSLSCPEFVREAHQALEREEAKADNFLDSETKAALLPSIEKVIISDYAKKISEVYIYIYI